MSVKKKRSKFFREISFTISDQKFDYFFSEIKKLSKKDIFFAVVASENDINVAMVAHV